MAQVSFTIPDAIISRVNNGVAKYHGYATEIDDPANPGSMIPNPESKGQFSKRMTREQWKTWVVLSETHIGGEAARALAEAEIDIQD